MKPAFTEMITATVATTAYTSGASSHGRIRRFRANGVIRKPIVVSAGTTNNDKIGASAPYISRKSPNGPSLTGEARTPNSIKLPEW